MPVITFLLLLSAPFALTWLMVDWILATFILLCGIGWTAGGPNYAWTGNLARGAFVLLFIFLTIEYWHG